MEPIALVPAHSLQETVLSYALPAKQYTNAEWEAKREVIKGLYINEGKTLREVMEIMESEYHFKAT